MMGKIRSVKLTTGSHEGIYPITNLRFLEFHKSDVMNHYEGDNTKNSENSECVGKVRPTRIAATKAKNAIKDLYE